MSLHTIIFTVGLIAIIIGVKRPWIGGLAGLMAFSLLVYMVEKFKSYPQRGRHRGLSPPAD